MANKDATEVMDPEQVTTPAAETQANPPDLARAAGPAVDVGQDGPISDLAADLQDAVPDPNNLEMLLDIDLKVTVELGRTQLKFRDVLNLSAGSVVELTKQTSEPVDILVNGALLATGEVVVAEDQFAVRITKLLSRVERLKKVL